MNASPLKADDHFDISRMAKDPTSRFAARRDDDDDDEDLPPRKKNQARRDDSAEDDEDERPKKSSKKAGGISPILIVGAVVGVQFLMTSCGCGIAVYLFYPSQPDMVTITGASRSTSNFRLKDGTSPQDVAISFVCNPNFTIRNNIQAVAECNGKQARRIIGNVMFPNTTGEVKWSAGELAGTSGAITVWIEDATTQRRISNKLTIY